MIDPMWEENERIRLRLATRDAWEWFQRNGHFAVAREVFGDTDPFNLTGASNSDLRRIIASAAAFQKGGSPCAST